LIDDGYEKDLGRVLSTDDLARGKSIIFCATGISDSALLRGVRGQGTRATTHSILMRAKSKTVRVIRATHDLQTKTIRLRSDSREHLI
jgi:fructose-1,6-bisphosphatase II